MLYFLRAMVYIIYSHLKLPSESPRQIHAQIRKERNLLTMARTIEELELGFSRIAAAQACRNLMGRYSYYHTAMRHRDYVKLWAERDDCLLVMPWGYYKGIEGVRKCYLQDHGDRNDPEIMNSPIFKGAMMMHCYDTEVLEVAADCKTAKACWISPGHESCFIPDLSGYPDWKKGDLMPSDVKLVPSCEWAWSKYQVDFINENGEWKFWKLRLWPIYKTDFYVSWTEHPDMDPADFPFKGYSSLPEPNWAWSPDSVYPAGEPEPPLPYERYEDAVPALWAKYV